MTVAPHIASYVVMPLAVLAVFAGAGLSDPSSAHAQDALPAITDLRIENDEILWTAPANVNRYSIRFYTGETISRSQSFSGCSYDMAQEQNINGSRYCAGEAVSITRRSGTTERLRLSQQAPKSFIVAYDDNSGRHSEVSNVVIYKTNTSSEPLSEPLSAINDLRIENGELRWTAPQDAYRYSIRFYTGETTNRSQSFNGCGGDVIQEQSPNGSRYCAGEAVSISRRPGATERLRILRDAGLSYVVTYSNAYGKRAELSNVVIHRGTFSSSAPSNVVPPAGYEDEVLINIDTYRNPFPDTNLGELTGKAAAELYRRAVIGGFPDGQFKGDRFVNRAEAAKFLLLARYGQIGHTARSNFPDVLNDQWYAKYVDAAAAKGIIRGYPDGLFKPNKQVNTGEFLKMLSATFDLPQNMRYHYNDVPSDSWVAPYAGIAEQYHLFPNRSSYLSPATSLTRAEIAVAIYQYLQNR